MELMENFLFFKGCSTSYGRCHYSCHLRFVSGGLYTCLLVIRGITYDIVDDITTVCHDHEGPLFLRRELLETNKYVVRIEGIQIRVTDRDIRRVRRYPLPVVIESCSVGWYGHYT